MKKVEATIQINVDATNPGQFFACCGLLELADRMWCGAEGWFRDNVFHLAPIEPVTDSTAEGLMNALVTCPLANTMKAEQVARRTALGQKKKAELSKEEEEEKKGLDQLWREEPLVFGSPFHLRLDWWTDERAGGSRYKTWAGQQSVIDIARAMKQAIEQLGWHQTPSTHWLCVPGGEGVPFNFDSDLGAQSASLDVGFSLDPLKMGTRARPLIELVALIGLQRFRPASTRGENRHRYALWQAPLLASVAAVAATGMLGFERWPLFEFPLLYRTKYLKSFLPAKPIRGDK